jgi:hypothetical protein
MPAPAAAGGGMSIHGRRTFKAAMASSSILGRADAGGKSPAAPTAPDAGGGASCGFPPRPALLVDPPFAAMQPSPFVEESRVEQRPLTLPCKSVDAFVLLPLPAGRPLFLPAGVF